MEKDIDTLVQIDENALDRECVRLPTDYLKVSHLSSEAKFEADEAKSELDVTAAELANDIRADPKAYDIEKITETAVQNTLIAQELYQKAQKKLRQATHKARMAESLVWAMEHKKRSLTLLVELHGLGYFSSPRVSKEGKDAIEEANRRKARRRPSRKE